EVVGLEPDHPGYESSITDNLCHHFSHGWAPKCQLPWTHILDPGVVSDPFGIDTGRGQNYAPAGSRSHYARASERRRDNAAAQLCGHQDIETLRFHAGANFFNTMDEVDILHGR